MKAKQQLRGLHKRTLNDIASRKRIKTIIDNTHIPQRSVEKLQNGEIFDEDHKEFTFFGKATLYGPRARAREIIYHNDRFEDQKSQEPNLVETDDYNEYSFNDQKEKVVQKGKTLRRIERKDLDGFIPIDYQELRKWDFVGERIFDHDF